MKYALRMNPHLNVSGQVDTSTARFSSLLLVLVLSLCVSSILTIQLFIEEVSRQFGLDEETLGLLAAAETGSAALMGLVGFLRPQLFSKPVLILATLSLVAGATLTALAETSDSLWLARALSGAGAGALASWGYRQTLMFTDTARLQGMSMIGQSAVLVFMFLTVPALSENYPKILYLFCAVLSVLILPLVIFYKSPQAAQSVKASIRPAPGWLLFTLLVVSMYASHGAFDAFIAELGTQQGLALTDIGLAMVFACGIGFPAGAIAIWAGDRLGLVLPLIAAGLCLSAGVLFLLIEPLPLPAFWAAVIFYNFGWVLAFPFLMQFLQHLRGGEQLAGSMLFIMGLGMASGAAFSGALAESSGLQVTLITWVVICSLLSFVWLVLLARRVKPECTVSDC